MNETINQDTHLLNYFLTRQKRFEDIDYKCTMCSYTTKRFREIVMHNNKHTGEKPYQCTKCNFKTAWSSSFYRHECTHTT